MHQPVPEHHRAQPGQQPLAVRPRRRRLTRPAQGASSRFGRAAVLAPQDPSHLSRQGSCGVRARDPRHSKQPLGLVLDDVLLPPAAPNVVPSEVDTETRTSPERSLNVRPAPTGRGTAAEARTAVAMAGQGGIGVVAPEPVDRRPEEPDGDREAVRGRDSHLPGDPFGGGRERGGGGPVHRQTARTGYGPRGTEGQHHEQLSAAVDLAAQTGTGCLVQPYLPNGGDLRAHVVAGEVITGQHRIPAEGNHLVGASQVTSGRAVTEDTLVAAADRRRDGQVKASHPVASLDPLLPGF
ncbi:IMP dehydrogenase [Kitasatospora sp. NA04385]|uniref:IMP dehydrogenase n=1 Tax=Kitasatospora sp. NA04385 TaxID=2742135 RepID=UPI0034CDCD3A